MRNKFKKIKMLNFFEVRKFLRGKEGGEKEKREIELVY